MTLDLSIRLIAGILLGAAIGLERQWRSRLAGIRTNALVAGGAALFVVLGAYGFDGEFADPTRVAAQVVTGIGFLGAGVILREGLNIRGLNTAATLWCAAAIGSLAGAGLYILAVVGTLAVIGANTLMRPISRYVNSRHAVAVSQAKSDPSAREAITGHPDDSDEDAAPHVGYMLEARTTDKSEPRVRALMVQTTNRPDLTLRSIHSSKKKNSTVVVQAGLSADAAFDPSTLERAIQRISLDPKVSSVRWWAEEDSHD